MNVSASLTGSVETDMTCQAFATWLTELRSRNSRTLQEMMSEMSIIRDGITSNNMELTDFKRNSTGISQQMQSQLTDLREKLTNAFGEITTLVKQKTHSDQEMMQDINNLQQNLSTKTTELEALKKSYSQAHSQLQTSLIQIQNHVQVTNSEVQTARSSCERLHRDAAARFGEIDSNLRGLEEDLSMGNMETRNQMLQLQEEIARIHDSLSSVTSEFMDHKRAMNSVHNKLQSVVWSLEEGRRRQSQGGEGKAEQTGASGQQSQQPPLFQATPPTSTMSVQQPPSEPIASSNYPAYAVLQGGMTAPGSMHQVAGHQMRPGSATLPVMLPAPMSSTVISQGMLPPQRNNAVVHPGQSVMSHRR